MQFPATVMCYNVDQERTVSEVQGSLCSILRFTVLSHCVPICYSARAAHHAVGVPGARGLVPLLAPPQPPQLQLQRQPIGGQPARRDPDDLRKTRPTARRLYILTACIIQCQRSAAFSCVLICTLPR